MLADNKSIENDDIRGKFIIPLGTSCSIYFFTLKSCIPFFLAVVKSHPNRRKLNEDGLSQLLVMEISKYLSFHNYPFGVQPQYIDTIGLTRGRPDFFFFSNLEQGTLTLPMYVVEAKRLPSQTYKTEYVIGQTQNGGIERFKIEKHGKGINICGIVGYVENLNCEHWWNEVNCWIDNQVKTSSDWKEDEKLVKIVGSSLVVSEFSSTVHIVGGGDKQLEHIWIDIQ